MKTSKVNRAILGFLFVVLVLILGLCQSCGIRKSQADKSKVSVSESNKTQEKTETQSSSVKQETKSEVNENDKTEETLSTTVIEEFNNPLPGQPNKKTTVTNKGKIVDKSKSAVNTKAKDSTQVIAKADKKADSKKASNQVNKSKSVDADKSFVTNVGGWGVVIVITVIFAGAILVYFLFIRKR